MTNHEHAHEDEHEDEHEHQDEHEDEHVPREGDPHEAVGAAHDSTRFVIPEGGLLRDGGSSSQISTAAKQTLAKKVSVGFSYRLATRG